MNDVLNEIAARLKEAGITDPRREARALIMAVTGVDPLLSSSFPASRSEGKGILRSSSLATLAEDDNLEEAVIKRIQRIPLSKIIGIKDFYGREFITSEHVLDPRPDSETIIEQALKICPDNARILDLGTGSGCLILTMLAEKRDATGVAVDLSPEALDIARQNAVKLGVSERVEFIEASFESYNFSHPELGSGSMSISGIDPETSSGCGIPKFNLLLSNPPYIPSAEIETLEPEVKDNDPRLALDGGADGCDPYHAILQRMSDFLLPGSHFILEFSPDICEKVSRLAVQAGHTDVNIIRDLAGRERVLLGRCG